VPTISLTEIHLLTSNKVQHTNQCLHNRDVSHTVSTIIQQHSGARQYKRIQYVTPQLLTAYSSARINSLTYWICVQMLGSSVTNKPDEVEFSAYLENFST